MLYYLLTSLYVLVCLLLLLVILLQQGKGGDMASAFGGGSSQTAFGARTGATLLTKLTTGFAVAFMLGATGARRHGSERAWLGAERFRAASVETGASERARTGEPAPASTPSSAPAPAPATPPTAPPNAPK